MSGSSGTATSASVSLSGLGLIAAIVLGVLKLGGVLTLSWWLVTAPLWVPLALAAVVAVVGLLVALVVVVGRAFR